MVDSPFDRSPTSERDHKTVRGVRRPRGAMRSVAFVVVLSVSLLVGCQPGQVGMGLPRQHDGESYTGDRQHLTGVLEVASNGCINIDLNPGTYLIIWPKGSDYADLGQSPAGVRLPDGHVIAPGDTLSGTGALTPTAPLVANRDGYWSHAIGYCAPGASEVVVFDSVGG